MNKKIALAALALSASLALTACDFINSALGNNALGSDSHDFQTTVEPTTTSTFENPEITTTTVDEATENNSDAEGGNPDIADYIEVTVSEDKYFYDNHEISYDDLIELLDGLDENTAVKISDENATLKAYESLTEALEERGILIVEAS